MGLSLLPASCWLLAWRNLQQFCLSLVSCWYLVVLLFDFEDGGSTVVQNISERLPNHMVLHTRLYTISSLRFQWRNGVLYIFPLDYGVHDQPVIVCDCFKFSYNLIGMLHHECERKERTFLKVLKIKVENTMQWFFGILLSTIHTHKHFLLCNNTFQRLISKVRNKCVHFMQRLSSPTSPTDLSW
jgi:hypothetical protein